MCNGNLKNFSNAGGWSMAFYGFAASLATPSTWSLSAVSVAVSARAVGRGGWPKVPPCWLMKYCLNNPCVSGVLSFPFQLRFLFGVVCGKGRNPTLRLWPAIFSGEIDVFPGDRRSRLISSMTSCRTCLIAAAIARSRCSSSPSAFQAAERHP